MENDVAELVYELESSGHKLTKLRQTVIEIFGRRQQPLLLEELGRLLYDRFIKVHRTTLYRELIFLQDKKMIVSVMLKDGKTRYEFADRGHHHHLVCTSCKKIEDVELRDDEHGLDKLVKTQNDFLITHHSLEFFGLCGACK